MQILLTEEEYNHLKVIKTAHTLKERARLLKFCRFVADNLPQKDWRFMEGDEVANPQGFPWGCIITKDPEDMDDWYCDECPSQEICPYEYKRWSK